MYDLDLNHGTQLAHVKSIVSETIISPNNLVVIDDKGEKGGFLFSNDHSTKVSPSRDKEISGSISYCRTDTDKYHFAATENLAFPNCITRDLSSGLIYIAHSARGAVTVHQLVDEEKFVQVD